MNVIYPTEKDELRFLMQGNVFWTRHEASQEASVDFLAWNQTNNATCGEHIVNITDVVRDEYLSELKTS